MSKVTALMLELKTQNFWNISKVSSGKSRLPMTTEFAINTLSAIQKSCNPKQQLRVQASKLLSQIIIGPEKKQA